LYHGKCLCIGFDDEFAPFGSSYLPGLGNRIGVLRT
jgi:hypothetical protein